MMKLICHLNFHLKDNTQTLPVIPCKFKGAVCPIVLCGTEAIQCFLQLILLTLMFN